MISDEKIISMHISGVPRVAEWLSWKKRALWPRTVKLCMALVSPKWDYHLDTGLTLFPQWNDWWAEIRRESIVENSVGSAYHWFWSTSSLVHLYSPPKASGRTFKCVKAVCARWWVRASNTLYRDSITSCSSLSRLLSNLTLLPLLCKLPLFPLLY